MKLIAHYEHEVFVADRYAVLFFSTDDASASAAPPSRKPKKLTFGMNCVFKDGLIDPFSKKHLYSLDGKWEKGKYGLQFVVSDYEMEIGKDREDIVSYLMTIDGIGKGLADRIYHYFGSNTVDILKSDFNRVAEVPRFPRKKLDVIRASFEAKGAYRKAFEFLSGFSLSARKVRAVFDKYGTLSQSVIEENPFLVSMDHTISFADANSIAVELGTSLKSDGRMSQAVAYIIESYFRLKGNLYADLDKVVKRVLEMLNKGVSDQDKVEEKDVARVVSQMISAKELHSISSPKSGKVYIYLHRDWVAECDTAQNLVDRVQDKTHPFVLKPEVCLGKIEEEEKHTSIRLNERQKQAIVAAMSNPISIITGGPGTGKTTLLKFLLNIFQKNFGDHIGLCSPTGKAARRMGESTGFEDACTVHSLLGISTGHVWSEDDLGTTVVEYDLLIVDEVSMMDMELAYLLLSSINKQCKVVLIGDVDQLPSVGAGNVLKELISSNVIPTTILDQIYRQDKQSKIVINAAMLNHGENNFDLSSKDFCLVKSKDQVEEKIANYYVKLIQSGRYHPDQVQVLTPYRSDRFLASTGTLNKRIQQMINPPGASKREMTVNKTIFRVGDRVIQQRNTDKAKNGDTGWITAIKADEETGSIEVWISFTDGEDVRYTKDLMEEYRVDLAYAMTVHKSQGSEFNVVIMPSCEEHVHMLTRKLVYTAWTRAKEHVLLVGSLWPVKQAAKNNVEEERNTLLGKRIQKLYQAGISK